MCQLCIVVFRLTIRCEKLLKDAKELFGGHGLDTRKAAPNGIGAFSVELQGFIKHALGVLDLICKALQLTRSLIQKWQHNLRVGRLNIFFLLTVEPVEDLFVLVIGRLKLREIVLQIEELHTTSLGSTCELIDKPFEVREAARHCSLNEVKQSRTVRSFGIHELINAADTESVGTTLDTRGVEIVTEQQNQVEQLSKFRGVHDRLRALANFG